MKKGGRPAPPEWISPASEQNLTQNIKYWSKVMEIKPKSDKMMELFEY